MFIFQKFGIIGVNEFSNKGDLFKYISTLTQTERASFFLSSSVSREFAYNGIDASKVSPLINLDRKLTEGEQKAVDFIAGKLENDAFLIKINGGQPLPEKRRRLLARATFEVYQKFQGAEMLKSEKDVCTRDGFCFATMVIQEISEELLSKFIKFREKRKEILKQAFKGVTDKDIDGYSERLAKLNWSTNADVGAQNEAKTNIPPFMLSAIRYYLNYLLAEKDHERAEFAQRTKESKDDLWA